MKPLAKPGDIRLMIEAAAARTRDELFLACANRDERFDALPASACIAGKRSRPGPISTCPGAIADATLFVPQSRPGMADAPTAYVFLEEDGDLYRLPMGREPQSERIADSGLWQEDAQGWGYLTAVSQIGASLYACGGGGQVYRRGHDGRWEHIDRGILRTGDNQKDLNLQAIAGAGEQEIYAGGWHTDVNDGVLLCWDGRRWAPAAHGMPSIECIHIEHEASVWACGRHGTLLHGNCVDGFKQVLEPDRSRSYVSVVSYDDQIFLATETGLFVYEDGSACRVKTGLTPEFDDGHLLQAVDGMLWAVGYKDIIRFDGRRWERIPFPGNPPIGV